MKIDIIIVLMFCTKKFKGWRRFGIFMTHEARATEGQIHILDHSE